jgi:hypothetical protein
MQVIYNLINWGMVGFWTVLSITMLIIVWFYWIGISVYSWITI